jgi:hypothetical protein
MPILGPATTVVTIANLEAETILKLENRTSETASVDRWLRDALIELTGNPDLRDSFSELEVLGAITNLTGGTVATAVQEYPESQFIALSSDYNIKTLDFMIWTDYPTNNNRKQLNPSHYQETDKFNSYPSLPTEWYRFGNTIGFDPPPNKNYQVQARIMRRHPITDYFNAVGALNSTVILMPNEWFEILEWSAAMRGFMELLEFEKASEIRTLLWGDPEHPVNMPGLIAAVKTKRRQESWMQQQPLRPIIKGSCWGSS